MAKATNIKADYTHEEREEIAQMLITKFSGTIYSVVPWQINFSSVWELMAFKDGKAEPESNFRVRVTKCANGWLTTIA